MRYKLTREIGGDVPDRLMAAAEELFAKKGLDVSVRELTSTAGVSLPSVNYYFGSKDGLAEALFHRLAERVNTERILELDKCLAAAKKSRRLPKLDDILSSFLRPYVDPKCRNSGQLLSQFILHFRLHPTKVTERITREHFDPMAQRYILALALACPKVSRAELYWRYLFMLNAVVLTIADNRPDNRLFQLSSGKADATDKTALKSALFGFLKNGLAG